MVVDMNPRHTEYQRRKEMILSLLDRHGVCSAPAMARAMDTSSSNTRYVLLEMVEEGTIERHPMAQQCYRRTK